MTPPAPPIAKSPEAVAAAPEEPDPYAGQPEAQAETALQEPEPEPDPIPGGIVIPTSGNFI